MAQEEGQIMEGMQSLDGVQPTASAGRVGNIVGLGTDEIAQAAAK